MEQTMQTNINYQTNFQSIHLNKGGIEFLNKEGGINTVNRYHTIKDKFSSYKWHLNIDENGYSLVSPRESKTYVGPFSIKKMIKNKNQFLPRIVFRMDDTGKKKYVVHCNSVEEVKNLYKKIKKAQGFEKMLLILASLENHIKDIL